MLSTMVVRFEAMVEHKQLVVVLLELQHVGHEEEHARHGQDGQRHEPLHHVWWLHVDAQTCPTGPRSVQDAHGEHGREPRTHDRGKDAGERDWKSAITHGQIGTVLRNQVSITCKYCQSGRRFLLRARNLIWV